MAKEKHTWDSSHLWTEELEILKSIISGTELVETVKWGAPVYTFNGKNVLGVMGFKNFFTMWFYKGVFIKDEGNVLINANEEETKSLRQWRFTSAADIDEKLVLKYIQEAIEVEKANIAMKPAKKELAVPQQLQQELETSPELAEAFNKLTAYKQREYAEFITSAKREATVLARLEKIKPLVLAGSGLNDKYK